MAIFSHQFVANLAKFDRNASMNNSIFLSESQVLQGHLNHSNAGLELAILLQCISWATDLSEQPLGTITLKKG